jgi:hypothetical protein
MKEARDLLGCIQSWKVKHVKRNLNTKTSKKNIKLKKIKNKKSKGWKNIYIYIFFKKKTKSFV